MENEISFEGITSGKKFDKDGNLIKEYNKKIGEVVNIESFKEGKICIDSNMMTLAILKLEFKKLLIENKGDDTPFTTESFKKESISNLSKIKRIPKEEAKKEFEIFEKEIGLRRIEFKEEYYTEGSKLFSDVLKSGIRIKKKSTFLSDCVNLVTIKHNNVSTLFSNDEDLEKVCKNFIKSIKIVKIPLDSTKIIKDYFKFQKKGQKVKR